jgi:carbonic anhydrase
MAARSEDRVGLLAFPRRRRQGQRILGVDSDTDGDDDYDWTGPVTSESDPFGDLLVANRAFAEHFSLQGFDGVARAGVAIVTCMDSRIDPLRMIGLHPGDAKIFRNPGGRVTDAALEAIVLGVHLLNVERVLVIPHTRCAMASHTAPELRDRVSASAGQDASWQVFHVVEDQEAALREDVRKVRTHPLVPETVAVGGFLYDVDTGLLDRRV